MYSVQVVTCSRLESSLYCENKARFSTTDRIKLTVKFTSPWLAYSVCTGSLAHTPEIKAAALILPDRSLSDWFFTLCM